MTCIIHSSGAYLRGANGGAYLRGATSCAMLRGANGLIFPYIYPRNIDIIFSRGTEIRRKGEEEKKGKEEG